MDATKNIPLRALAETVSCLCLTAETEVQKAVVEFCAGLGLDLVMHTPRTAAEAQVLARKTHAFTLAHLRNPSQIGAALSPVMAVRSVVAPPLVVLTDWIPTPAEREQLRLVGVAQVLEWPLSSERSGRDMRRFADANASFRLSPDFMVITDLLQTMGQHRRSGLVTVSCPHHRDFGAEGWRNGAGCDGTPDSACHGWYGRLYVVEGVLVHAETPSQQAVAALALMMQLARPTMRIQLMFIAPAQPNLSGPLENNILNAALIIDNREDGRAALPRKPTLKDIPTRAVSRPPPLPPDRSAKRSDDMKWEAILGAAPELRAAVRADGNGEVIEAVGGGDADSLSAVVGMCNVPLERIAELLGLRGLHSWSFSTADLTVHVFHEEKGYLAVAGGASKNGDGTFKKLAQLVKGGR